MTHPHRDKKNDKPRIMKSLKKWGIIIGLVGGIVGAILGGWGLYDRYEQRRPKLAVFIPYHWAGKDQETGDIYILYLRISNISQAPAYLYMETLKIEIFENNKWQKAQVLHLPSNRPLVTDLPTGWASTVGIFDAKPINRFTDGLVTYDKPLCGYLFVKSPFKKSDPKLSKVRVSVFDSYLKKKHPHIIDVDISEQINSYDPRTY